MSVSCLRSVCKRKCNAPVGPMQDVQETFVFHEKLLQISGLSLNSQAVEFTVKCFRLEETNALYRDLKLFRSGNNSDKIYIRLIGYKL